MNGVVVVKVRSRVWLKFLSPTKDKIKERLISMERK
jgi:hypothetical protein